MVKDTNVQSSYPSRENRGEIFPLEIDGRYFIFDHTIGIFTATVTEIVASNPEALFENVDLIAIAFPTMTVEYCFDSYAHVFPGGREGWILFPRDREAHGSAVVIWNS